MKIKMKLSTKILALVFISLIGFNFFKWLNDSGILDDSGRDYIPTLNYANPALKYYYFIPFKARIDKSKPVHVLVLVPGLSGDGEEFASKPAFKKFASKEGFVIVAPTFIEDIQNWDDETSYQYPVAWSGKALNDILAIVSKEKNLKISSLYMLGFSAGAQFVSRYSLLYPSKVTACAINAAGGTDVVQKYQQTKFYYAVGTKDMVRRQQVAYEFYRQAKALGIDESLNKYNYGHTLSDKAIDDELTFFDKVNNPLKK